MSDKKSTEELAIWLDGISLGDRIFHTDYHNFTESGKRLREITSLKKDAYKQALEDVINGLVKQKSWTRGYAEAIVCDAAREGASK